MSQFALGKLPDFYYLPVIAPIGRQDSQTRGWRANFGLVKYTFCKKSLQLVMANLGELALFLPSTHDQFIT